MLNTGEFDIVVSSFFVIVNKDCVEIGQSLILPQ